MGMEQWSFLDTTQMFWGSNLKCQQESSEAETLDKSYSLGPHTCMKWKWIHFSKQLAFTFQMIILDILIQDMDAVSLNVFSDPLPSSPENYKGHIRISSFFLVQILLILQDIVDMKYLLAGDHHQLTWHHDIIDKFIYFVGKLLELRLDRVEETLPHVGDMEASGDDDEGEPVHVHFVQAEAQLCPRLVAGGSGARLRRDLERKWSIDAFKIRIIIKPGAKYSPPHQWRAENTRCWSGPRPGWSRGRDSPGASPHTQRGWPLASPGQSPQGWDWRKRDPVRRSWGPHPWDIQRGCSLETWPNSFWQLYSLQIFGTNLQKQCAAELLNKLPTEQLQILKYWPTKRKTYFKLKFSETISWFWVPPSVLFNHKIGTGGEVNWDWPIRSGHSPLSALRHADNSDLCRQTRRVNRLNQFLKIRQKSSS